MAASGGETVCVRGVHAEDVDQIVEIERVSFGDPWSRDAFQTFAEHNAALFLTAHPEKEVERVIGYGVTMRIGPEAELLNIAVHPDWRGKGVARRLLDGFLAVLAKDEVEMLFLEVRESNHRARRLYECFGFTEIGRRRRYYRKPVEDALILRRAVREPEPAAGVQSNDSGRN
jgi:[ribosomal protein S18]-alanine N-acetyltransferase